jgi:AcrR family transcriptional regulator
MATDADSQLLAPGEAGRPPAKQARSRRTRQRLIEAGLQLLEEHDFDATGIADFAAAAGASVGAFYHHFTDKDDFYGALVASGIDKEWQRVEAELSAAAVAGLSASAIVDKTVRLIRDIMAGKQGLIRTALKRTMAAGESTPGAWAPMREFARAYEERAADLLKMRAGQIGRPDWRARHGEAMQVVFSTLFNGIVNRPLTLGIADEATVPVLSDIVHRYLEITPA